MQARLAQLANNPADVDTLRIMLPDAPKTSDWQTTSSPEPWQGDAPPDSLHGLLPDSLPDAALPAAAPLDEIPPDEYTAPNWPDESMEDTTGIWEKVEHWDALETIGEPQPQALPASNPEGIQSTTLLKNTVPALPTRFEREAAPLPFYSAAPSPAAASPTTRKLGGKKDDTSELQLQPKLRLFGKSAAHTLEVTDHRRGGDFMGTHVVSIDSAAANGTHGTTSGTYAWERKLVIQLTPEEMPAIVATFMGLTPSVRFGNHSADKSKFIEVRRQEGGLVIVTGDKAASYSVPVPTRTAYYVLDLFCRAMAMSMSITKDGPGRSVSDILALVRAVHGV